MLATNVTLSISTPGYNQLLDRDVKIVLESVLEYPLPQVSLPFQRFFYFVFRSHCRGEGRKEILGDLHMHAHYCVIGLSFKLC